MDPDSATVATHRLELFPWLEYSSTPYLTPIVDDFPLVYTVMDTSSSCARLDATTPTRDDKAAHHTRCDNQSAVPEAAISSSSPPPAKRIKIEGQQQQPEISVSCDNTATVQTGLLRRRKAKVKQEPIDGNAESNFKQEAISQRNPTEASIIKQEENIKKEQAGQNLPIQEVELEKQGVASIYEADTCSESNGGDEYNPLTREANAIVQEYGIPESARGTGIKGLDHVKTFPISFQQVLHIMDLLFPVPVGDKSHFDLLHGVKKKSTNRPGCQTRQYLRSTLR